MKRISLILISIVFLFIGLTAKAETTTTTYTDSNGQLVDPGLVPGDTFYFLDRFFEDVSLWFTFSDDGKVAKYSGFAEERLAELNKINPENNQSKIDKLFDEYAINLTKANELLTDVIIKGNVKQLKIERLQEKLADVTTKDELINTEIMEKVNQEVKNKVSEIKVQSYLTTMSGKLSKEEKTVLQDLNIRGNDRLKIKSLAELAGMSVEEIINLDIFYPDDPTTGVVEREFDYNKLESVLGLSKNQLIDNLKEYNEAIKERRKAENEERNADNQKGKSQEEIDEIKEDANRKKEEAEERREEIEERIKENIEKNNDNKGGQGNNDEPGPPNGRGPE